MPRLPALFLVFIAVSSGCGGSASSPHGQPPAAAPEPPRNAGPVSERAERGRLAYQRTCARCHEDGQGGAPVTGRAEDWKNRSMLWQAVLFAHADRGYLKMPARGGEPSLDEADVEAAAEYMLNRSHPGALHD